MAKAMWVTLPCVLLLLDCWPLRRWRPEQPWRLKGIGWLLIEKIPLLVLSAVSCGVTFAVQQSSKAVVDVVALPLQYRIGNALVSYAGYLKKTLVPIDLIVLYPHPGADLPLGQTALAAAILLIITLAALTNVRRWPFLLVGWLWYLGTLVPVIGLVQVGEQGMADRYSYGPSLGLFIMLSWSAASFVGSWRLPRLTVALGASAVLLTLGLLTWNQTSHWQNGETLWRHALAVDSQLDRAHIHLATIYQTRNQPERAVTHFNAALRLRPDDGNTHYNFANLLFQLGRHEEASQHYQHAIQINPNDASALCNHGSVLIQLGRPARAIQSFLQVLRISFAPQESLHAYRGLAQAYLEQGQHRDAIDALRQALQISPQDAPAHLYLGHAYLGAGRAQDAVRCYRHALQLDPSLTEAKRALTQQPATSSAASNPK